MERIQFGRAAEQWVSLVLENYYSHTALLIKFKISILLTFPLPIYNDNLATSLSFPCSSFSLHSFPFLSLILILPSVQYILNVTREIDNFFPGVFEYHNIRVYDEEATDLLAYWNDTYKFISRAR